MGPFMEFGMVSLCVAVIMYLWSLKEKNINIVGFAITLVVATYILLGIFRKHIKNFIPIPSDLYQENKSQLKEDLLANKSYFITELAQYSSQYGMILIASFSLSSSAVGQFTIIQQLAFIINFILGVSVNTISSYFASYGETKDYLMIKKVKRKVQLIMLIWLIPMLITAFTFSSSILELFGVFSKEADLAFRLLCIVQTLNALSGLSLAVLNMTGHELMVSKISLIVLIIQILLAIVLSLNFGILGLVLAFSASTLLRNGLSVYFETKVLRRVRTI
jgi:O-antigen/teichoic acid export membrane protein